MSIGLEQLIAFGDQAKYADEYIFISEHISHILQGERRVKLNFFMLLYCQNGEVSANINNMQWRIGSGDILAVRPNLIVDHVTTSADSQIHMVCYSKRFLNQLPKVDKRIWRVVEKLHDDPVLHLNEEQQAENAHYLALLKSKTKGHIDQYGKDILLHLASAMFCEMITTANSYVTTTAAEQPSTQSANSVSRSYFVFKQFLQLLSADNGRHRTVEYYARQLCYTRKYLSAVVKRESGRNALVYINENAIGHIISELRHTDKDIQQIAYDFEFTNNSFFTRFFRKHTGMTPTEFRNRQQ